MELLGLLLTCLVVLSVGEKPCFATITQGVGQRRGDFLWHSKLIPDFEFLSFSSVWVIDTLPTGQSIDRLIGLVVLKRWADKERNHSHRWNESLLPDLLCSPPSVYVWIHVGSLSWSKLRLFGFMARFPFSRLEDLICKHLWIRVNPKRTVMAIRRG